MAQERSSSRSTCSLDTAVVCAACFVGVGLQRGVICAVFLCLPTGFCYALLPAVFDGLRGRKLGSNVLCLSPLDILSAHSPKSGPK